MVTVQFYFMYCDNAPELTSACASELMLHLSSTPNRPKSNSIIERFIQLIVEGTRCLLFQSGLPPRYWNVWRPEPFAWAATRLGQLITEPTRGQRRMALRLGENSLPFGCKVTFRPAEQAGPKFGPRSEFGIFVGWFLLPGGVFKG